MTPFTRDSDAGYSLSLEVAPVNREKDAGEVARIRWVTYEATSRSRPEGSGVRMGPDAAVTALREAKDEVLGGWSTIQK